MSADHSKEQGGELPPTPVFLDVTGDLHTTVFTDSGAVAHIVTSGAVPPQAVTPTLPPRNPLTLTAVHDPIADRHHDMNTAAGQETTARPSHDAHGVKHTHGGGGYLLSTVAELTSGVAHLIKGDTRQEHHTHPAEAAPTPHVPVPTPDEPAVHGGTQGLDTQPPTTSTTPHASTATPHASTTFSLPPSSTSLEGPDITQQPVTLPPALEQLPPSTAAHHHHHHAPVAVATTLLTEDYVLALEQRKKEAAAHQQAPGGGHTSSPGGHTSSSAGAVGEDHHHHHGGLLATAGHVVANVLSGGQHTHHEVSLTPGPLPAPAPASPSHPLRDGATSPILADALRGAPRTTSPTRTPITTTTPHHPPHHDDEVQEGYGGVKGIPITSSGYRPRSPTRPLPHEPPEGALSPALAAELAAAAATTTPRPSAPSPTRGPPHQPSPPAVAAEEPAAPPATASRGLFAALAAAVAHPHATSFPPADAHPRTTSPTAAAPWHASAPTEPAAPAPMGMPATSDTTAAGAAAEAPTAADGGPSAPKTAGQTSHAPEQLHQSQQQLEPVDELWDSSHEPQEAYGGVSNMPITSSGYRASPPKLHEPHPKAEEEEGQPPPEGQFKAEEGPSKAPEIESKVEKHPLMDVVQKSGLHATTLKGPEGAPLPACIHILPTRRAPGDHSPVTPVTTITPSPTPAASGEASPHCLQVVSDPPASASSRAAHATLEPHGVSDLEPPRVPTTTAHPEKGGLLTKALDKVTAVLDTVAGSARKEAQAVAQQEEGNEGEDEGELVWAGGQKAVGADAVPAAQGPAASRQ